MSVANITAVQRFKEFITSGQYQKYKQLEQRQKEARNYIRKYLQNEEGNRFEFKEYGYVGRFVRKTTSRTDHAALLEELTNYLSVPALIQLDVLTFEPSSEDVKSSVEPFLLPADYYVRPNLNSAGKVYVNVQKGYYETYPQLVGYKWEIASYVRRDSEYQLLDNSYQCLKNELKLELKKSIETEFGKLSVISKKAEYDLLSILQEWGEEFLLANSKAKLTELNELMDMGILDKQFLVPFQEVIDVRVDFILQSLENEQKSWDILQQRKKKLQQFLAS